MSEQKGFFKSGVGIFLIGAIIADLVPSPSDFVHFWLQGWLYTQHDIMSKGLFLFWQSVDWYLVDTAWWVLLFIIAYLLHIRKASTIKQITVIGIIVSLGAIASIMLSFMRGV